MAAQVSPSDSPLAFEALQSEDESWNFMDIPADNSGAESVTFLPSPASGSLASYNVVVRQGHGHNSHSPSLSSLSMSPGQISVQVATSSPVQPTSAPLPSLLAGFDQQVPTSFTMQQLADQMAVSLAATGSLGPSTLAGSPFAMPASNTDAAMSNPLLNSTDLLLSDQDLRGLLPNFPATDFQATSALQASYGFLNQQQAPSQPQQPQQTTLLDFSVPFQTPADVAPWDPIVMEQQGTQMFPMDEYAVASPSPPSSFMSANISPAQSASPRSPTNIRQESFNSQHQLSQLQQFQLQQLQQFFQEEQQVQLPLRQPRQPQSLPLPIPQPSAAAGTTMAKTSAPSSSSSKSKAVGAGIKKAKMSGSRVEKRRPTNTSSTSDKFQLSTSLGSLGTDSSDNFVIVTPSTIHAHAGSGSRHNPYESFEAMNATQKGRKGPLADEIKESALQVRRVGACFCCHARKVRCDAQRPCKNCVKMSSQVPQIVCWRFDDFVVDLFPGVIRSHLRKDEMAKFVSDNVASFTVNGNEIPCTVRLSAGLGFKNTLEIRSAKFFSAKSDEVLHHARATLEPNQIRLSVADSAPIGLDLSDISGNNPSQQQERIKKACRVYVDSILKEDVYIDQITADIEQTQLPRKILTIVRRFYLDTHSPIVKQALTVYTMHYVMTHHLCLTQDTVMDLAHTNMVPTNDIFVTPRMLNRQIKALLDEMMREDVDKLFKMFTRELKPKARSSWAPCLAAFLVFCIFMESIGLALDLFAMSQNEKSRQCQASWDEQYRRKEIIHLIDAIDRMPFCQFAFQFHYIYSTHTQAANSSADASPCSSGSISSSSSSSSAVKPPFNPLRDNGLLLSGDIDKHSVKFVRSLQELLEGDSWNELDFLAANTILSNDEPHPYPRNPAFNYTGRLCSKFLLSFDSEDYIKPKA